MRCDAPRRQLRVRPPGMSFQAPSCPSCYISNLTHSTHSTHRHAINTPPHSLPNTSKSASNICRVDINMKGKKSASIRGAAAAAAPGRSGLDYALRVVDDERAVDVERAVLDGWQVRGKGPLATAVSGDLEEPLDRDVHNAWYSPTDTATDTYMSPEMNGPLACPLGSLPWSSDHDELAFGMEKGTFAQARYLERRDEKEERSLLDGFQARLGEWRYLASHCD